MAQYSAVGSDHHIAQGASSQRHEYLLGRWIGALFAILFRENAMQIDEQHKKGISVTQSKTTKSTTHWLPRSVLASALLVFGACLVVPLATVEAQTAPAAYAAAKNDPVKLRNFLFRMPKGGDLHNHLTGSIYAESYLGWAAEDGKCWDIPGQSISPGPCASEQVALAEVFPGGRETPRLSVDPMVDALSTRNFRLREESGHNQFFATFARFAEASFGRRGEMLAEVTHRAGRQNIVYLELMQSLGMLEAAELGKATADLDAQLGQRVDYAEVDKIAAAVVAQVDAMEAKARAVNRCDGDAASVGCQVKVRYLAQVLRTWDPQEVYVQTVLAYKLIEADPRIVGLNFVAPEDHPVALRDYRMHMQFIAEIGTLFPEQTKGITLHSGELALGLVPPENLGWHISEAIEVAGARRVGHAVDIAHTPDLYPLLKKMAAQQIMVEINLTSNDVILGIKYPYHPFELYMEYGVPMALSTDDEGVSRIDLTHEYQRAAQTFDLSYARLRSLSRNALQYNFLPGDALFDDTYKGKISGPCANQSAAEELSSGCAAFLDASEKAALQWDLEKRFAAFEASFD